MLTLLVGSVILGGLFYCPNKEVEEVNRCLAGHIVDYTHNAGPDNRIYSQILCEKRDLYVYLPPGYDPARKYTLIVWLHGAFGDETPFPRTGAISYLDNLIRSGCCPPVIVAAPDASIGGRNKLTARHSMFINGAKGNFEDHLIQEVIPFVMTNYSVRPEREGHVISGYSGGGLPAVALGIKYREMFSLVTVIAGPLNLRYQTCSGHYFENFSPETYRWSEDYSPHRNVAKYWGGLIHVPARFFVTPIFGRGDGIIDRVKMNNPADLLFSHDLQPDELQMFIRYAGRDNFNFDAQIESFIWLASTRGISIDAVKDPKARHTTEYCTEAQKRAYDWLAPRMLPPTEPESTDPTAPNSATPTEVQPPVEEAKPAEVVPAETSAK